MSGTVSGEICVVAGVGPGTGLACVERFAREGYQVAMLARNEGRLKEWEKAIPNTRGFAPTKAAQHLDVRDGDQALRRDLVAQRR